MKLNRKWLLAIALLLSMAVATAGTLAYLTDADKDVNTMTLGKVEIVQNEQKWNEDKTELVEYENDEPLYPYIGELGWTKTDYEDGAYRQFTMANVQDKYVTVTNTGKSDAYVRTIIAAEMGAYETVEEFRNKIIGFSRNVENGDEFKFPGAWVWEGFQVVELEDGNNYLIMTAVHKNPVKPGETTIPSLLQVYMNKECDNEEVEKVDGNKNGKYDIIALSQAVQVNGFEEMGPAAALNEGFGVVNEDNLKDWLGETEVGSPGDKHDTNNPPVPFAKVTILDEDDTLTNSRGVTIVGENHVIITEDRYFGIGSDEIPLDVAYQFEPTMSEAEGAASEWADWHADFVVSVNKDVPAYSIGLAGFYDAWCSMNDDKWVMLMSPEDISAGTELRLVDAMGGGSITVAYRELCQYGNDGIGFLCGAVAMDGHTYDGELYDAELTPGTILTVELRLYEATGGSRNTETGEYITAGVYTYTFD